MPCDRRNPQLMSNLTSLLESLVVSDDFRLNWLTDAEVSGTPHAPDKAGMSFFFEIDAEWQAFQRVFALPTAAIAHEDALRAAFRFVPRRWVKLHYIRQKLTGFSQYLIVDPALRYPITTLRLALKRSGVSDVKFIEAAFRPALERDDCLWAVILKSHLDGSFQPRLSIRARRELLPQLLANLVQAGRLAEDIAAGFKAVDSAMGAGDLCYLSIDLNEIGSASVDYSDVAEASVPPEVAAMTLPRYLKCQFKLGQAAPVWFWYAPAVSLMTVENVDFLRQWRQGGQAQGTNETVAKAREYYNREADAIVTYSGATYQAGLLRNRDAQTTNVEWGKRAGIRAGERVLDAGCGAGGPAVDIARAFPDVQIEGVTLSEAQAAHALLLTREAQLESRVRIHVADYHALPFNEATFDRALFLESIGYSPDLGLLFREIFRVVRPGGEIYIKDVFRPEGVMTAAAWLQLAEFDHVYAQQTPTTEEALAAITAAGFESLACQDITDELTTRAFHHAMFDSSPMSALASLGMGHAPEGSDTLNPFGLRHYRQFTGLPLRFAQIKARRP